MDTRKFIRVILILLSILVVAGVVLLYTFGWIINFQGELIDGHILALIYDISDVIIGVAFLSMILTISYWIGKMIFLQSSIVGTKNSSRIIALGLTTLLFYESIYSLLIYPIISLVNKFFSSLSSFNQRRLVDTEAQYFVVDSVTTIASNWWEILTQLIQDYLLFFPFKDAIIGLFILLILGRTADYISNNYKPNFQALGRQIRQNRQNILFTFLFLAGGFLSFSALVAVPYIEEGEHVHINDSTFVNFIDTTDYVNVEYAFYQSDDKHNQLLSMLDAIESIDLTGVDSTGNLQFFIRSFVTKSRSFANESKGNLRIIKDEWYELAKVITNKISFEKRFIEGAFKFSLERKAVGMERVDYAENLLIHFADFKNYHRELLEETKNEIQTYFDQDESNIDALIMSTERNLILIDEYLEEKDWLKAKMMRDAYTEYNPKPYIRYYNDSYLQRPKYQWRGNLGVFGIISNWVLNTKSNEMAILVGMLGFGVLGAGISSIIRRRSEKAKSIFQDNVSSTVVGGISAAFIIFLSAKGGSSVFKFEIEEINAYMLFFICLVGSVFSEAIWDRAYNFINKSKENIAEREEAAAAGKQQTIKQTKGKSASASKPPPPK